jgi:hypothetical protein
LLRTGLLRIGLLRIGLLRTSLLHIRRRGGRRLLLRGKEKPTSDEAEANGDDVPLAQRDADSLPHEKPSGLHTL